MTEKTYVRFEIAQRIEHVLLILSFTTLAITGLVQKYPLFPASPAIVSFFGGIETLRIIHRIAATMFVLESVYHLVVMGYKLFVQRKKATMAPGIKDATDALDAFKYNIGLAKEPPKMGRYNFTEKAEYWAMVWGLLVMAATGFMLWNPIATARMLPGQFIPAAKVAHGGEAVLAVLAIIVWHFYNVHIKHWNWSMIKGTLTRHQMVEEHALELEEIESGKVVTPPSPAEVKKRSAIYFPIALILAAVMTAVLLRFITFEQTAITTIPPVEANVEAFSPQTPSPIPTREPSATPSPDEGKPAITSLTWDGGVSDLFKNQCGSCHGALGGLALNSYADLLKGGNSGPAVVANDPAGSLLVQVQEAGNHPGQFSAEDLDTIKQWIEAGFPEK